MKTITKAILGFFAVIIVLAIIGAMVAPPEPTPEEVAGYNGSLVRNYEIVKTEDFSMKALDKSLSAYTSAEIDNLPMNIRKEYRVVVPIDISKEELKATLIQVVMDKTSENPDIDVIVIFAYDREEDVDDFYTFGRLIWSPDGETFAVPSTIASKNDHSSYNYSFDIRDKVGNAYVDRPTEREFEIHDIYYKALMEIPDEDILEDMHGAEAKVRARVAKELGISEEELDEIYSKVVGYKGR
jgi:hypothetical protein